MTSELKVDSIKNTAGVDALTIQPSGTVYISNANIPGNIVQVQHARYDLGTDTYDTIAADTRANSPVSLAFTPKFATSTLLIQTALHTRIVDANGCTYGVNRDGTAIPGRVNRNGFDFFYKGDTVNHHYTGRCQLTVAALNTNTTTFTIWAQGWSGGTWELSYGHGEHSISVWEIAA